MYNKAMKWFINWKFDLLFFLSPYWITWLVIVFTPKNLLFSDNFAIAAPLLLWILVEILLDGCHAWSTIFRTFLDRPTFQGPNHRLFFIIPVIGFLILFIFGLWGTENLLRLLFYSVYYHGVKQLFGIASLYKARFVMQQETISEKEKAELALQSKWDRSALNIVFFLPFLHWHFNMPESFSIPFRLDVETFQQIFVQELGISFLHSANLVFWGNGIFYFLIGFFSLGWLFVHLKGSLPKQWAKILWFISNPITYYLVLVAYPSDLLVVGSLLSVHALPYLSLIGLYNYRKLKAERNVQSIKQYAPYLTKGALLIAAFSFIQVFLIEAIVTNDRGDVAYFLGKIGLEHLHLNHWQTSLAMALLFLPNMVHYIYDAYIWRFNQNNPTLFNYIFSSRP